MRILYRPVWEGVQTSLTDIFVQGWPADKVIQRHLKGSRKWGSSDRRLYAESVYDLVRWWRKLLFLVDVQWPAEDRWSAEDREVYARVIEAWCLVNDVTLDKNVKSSGVDAHKVKMGWKSLSLPRAVRESMPDWLDAEGERQLGEKWNKVLPVLNTLAPVYLRANRLKTAPERLVNVLKQDQVEASVVESDCLKLAERANVFQTKAFEQGLFEVQDLSSQRVVPALGVEPGMRVIDACAGAGGKSLHMASLMANKGKILALDVTEKKLEALRERATRNGANTIETRLIDSTKVIKRLADGCERLLLDVPCSGVGVLRRNPDAKWKLKPEELGELKKTQAEILANYGQMLKAGGAMVYATCSIFPEENERQVEKFMSQVGTAWTLEAQETLWPENDGPDGFYFARLRKS